LLALLALGATVTVRPPDAPPLYDGLGFPDEPYRWVSPPAGQTRTPQPPTPASATIEVSGGESGPARAFSGEQGPQVAFAVADGAFTAPSGATAIEMTAVPEAVPAAEPAGGVVVSNLYRLSATSGGTPVPLAASATVVVNLRADRATTQSVVVSAWDGTSWTQIPTRQVGTEIYAAQVPTLDPVAVVRLDQGVRATVEAPLPSAGATAGAGPDGGTGTGTSVGDDGGIGGRTLLLTVGGIVALLAAALVVLRRRTGDDPG
ncbi:MAG: hypothetical protein ACKVZ6_19705, partial [Kineosporiaceae bacterium]